ncbi:hypothetical protein GGI07_002467 [Coemansia sp. Benny D115]|nr:hypothetical protein GGI07_002467 [Coemansia sp. Benny D115]
MSNAFFSSRAFAVVGASADPSKFGNKVLNWYINNGMKVTPINPKESQIEGIACQKSLTALAASLSSESCSDNGALENIGVSVITPPSVSGKVLQEAAQLGVKNIWFQPGSEPDNWQAVTRELGINALGNGACVLKVDPSTLPKSKL